MHTPNWFKWRSKHAAGPGDWSYDYIMGDPYEAADKVRMWIEDLAEEQRYQTDGFRGFDYEQVDVHNIPEDVITRMVEQTGAQINRLRRHQDILLDAYWACQKPVD